MISIANTQDALITDVKTHITGLKTVDVFDGEFSDKTLQQMILLTPFVLGSYRMPAMDQTQQGAAGESGIKKHHFMLIVGATTLLKRIKAQRSCLSIIDSLVEQYDGRPITVDGSPVTFGLESIESIISGTGIVVYGVSLATYD